MIYLLCCNLALLIALLARDLLVKKPKPSDNLHLASYNCGLRDAGEILRDIRVECGIQVGENDLIEEALHRIRLTFK